ncbi:hypothetical protein ANN_02734 [Periplaneta americana]|uniref:Histone-lysine N-methyltransferase SETMAR n=1 Tax=Periplaneta americana TaxID=6978 RepID=A0ABQ8TXB0_PERAM|nr:hypothetical protein ANN_02734 [Periplaneta americana]
MAGLCEGGNEPPGSLKANDAVLIADSEDNLQILLYQFMLSCHKHNMKISVGKTETMNVSKEPIRCELELQGKTEARADTIRAKQITEITEMNILRKIVKKIRLDRVRNDDIRKQCRIQTIREWMNGRRAEWKEHVGRMSEDRVPVMKMQRFSVEGGEGVLAEIVTEDESKRQSMEWHHTTSPKKKKSETVRYAGKAMATVFWDAECVILVDFSEHGRTISFVQYVETLKKLKARLRRVCPSKTTAGIFLLHDNARTHTSQYTTSEIAKIGWKVLPHPPYSPDLAPSDFHLSGPLKEAHRWHHFEDEKARKRKVRRRKRKKAKERKEKVRKRNERGGKKERKKRKRKARKVKGEEKKAKEKKSKENKRKERKRKEKKSKEGAVRWTLTLGEEMRLKVFENKVLRKIFGTKRDEVTGEWKKLHNAELHVLYSSPNAIMNIKSRRLRWTGHVARMGKSRNVLVGKLERKILLGKPRRRWKDNIKMDLRDVGCDGRDWINLAEDRDQWRAHVRRQ